MPRSNTAVGRRYLLEPQGKRPVSTYKHDQTIPVALASPHPITRGLVLAEIHDETYKRMWISPPVTVLLTTSHPAADPQIAWISAYPKSRVVALQPGHGCEAHGHPGYRTLVRNAILWSAGSFGEGDHFAGTAVWSLRPRLTSGAR